MRDTVTLSPDLAVMIARSLVEAQNWRPDQELVFVARGGSVLVVPMSSREALFGLAKGADPNRYRERDDRR